MARSLITISKDVRTFIPLDWLADEKDQLTFEYKPLSKRQLARVADNSSKMDINTNTILIGNSEVSIKLFTESVSGIKNLVVDEKAVKFKKGPNGGVADDIVELLPLDIIEEVAREILSVSKFGDADKESL